MKNKSCKNYVYVVWKFQTYHYKKYCRLDNMSKIVDMTKMDPIYAICYNKGEVNDYLIKDDFYYYICRKYYGDLGKLKRM